MDGEMAVWTRGICSSVTLAIECESQMTASADDRPRPEAGRSPRRLGPKAIEAQGDWDQGDGGPRRCIPRIRASVVMASPPPNSSMSVASAPAERGQRKISAQFEASLGDTPSELVKARALLGRGDNDVVAGDAELGGDGDALVGLLGLGELV